MSARTPRSRTPARTACGHTRATSLNPSLFGATTSRAIASVSTTNAPKRSNVAATTLLPAPMPPVNPTRIDALLRSRARLRRGLRGTVDADLFLGRVLLDDFGRHVGDVLN